MEEERCFRCDRSQEKVKLVDAIYNNEMVKVCEECALTEDIPVVRRPSSIQLSESEKPYTVRQRLRRMAGIKGDDKEVARKISDVKIDDLRKPKDSRTEMEKKIVLAKDRNKPISLVDNYNWMILMARKKRKITRHQLAEAIGENELAVKMIENKDLPDDALRIIGKIEQYLSVRLRKEEGKLLWPSLVKPKEDKEEKSEVKDEKKEARKEPAVVLKFDPNTVKNLKIDDLKKMREDRDKTETIEYTGKKALALKKEMNVSEIIWRSKQEEKKIEKNKDLIGNGAEFED